MSRNGLTLVETLCVVTIVGIIAALAVPFIRCAIASAPQQQSAIKFEPVQGALTASYDMKTVETVGNHSWMPLNIDGDTTKDRDAKPSEYRTFILGALCAFEKAHPELEVTGWMIEKDQHARGASDHIYGLWIDHRPRAEK